NFKSETSDFKSETSNLKFAIPKLRQMTLCAALLGVLSLMPAAWAQKLAVEGETIYTMSARGTIKDGVVLVENGKITQVGRAGWVTIPAGFGRLRARVVTPGLIDARTVVGLSGSLNIPAAQDQDETTDPNQADRRTIAGFNPAEPLLRYLL